MTSPVEQPEITHVISVWSGVAYASADLIRSIRYDRWMRLRRENAIAIRAGRPRLICQICHVPVRFAFSTQKRAFFRHVSEDGNCPAITRSGRTQADYREMIYRGQQESRLHRETKKLVAECLGLDTEFRDVLTESTWKAGDGLSLRRPDVRAVGPGGLRFAFEAQLTTTFLDVVADRSAFYAAEGGLLVWILRRFDPSYRRATEDDIFFPNNSNALVVDNATAAASRAAGYFIVRVHHRTISPGGEYGWADALVPFANLTFDVPGQRVFLYDFERIERETLAALRRRKEVAAETARRAAEQAAEAERAARSAGLRHKVLSFFEDEERITQEGWDDLRGALFREGIPTPNAASNCWGIARIINAFSSAERGRIVGYNLKNLVAVANYLHANQRGAVRAFLALIDVHGHRAAFHGAGDQAKWRAKEARLISDARNGVAEVRLPQDLRKLVFFLFPILIETRQSSAPEVHDSGGSGVRSGIA